MKKPYLLTSIFFIVIFVSGSIMLEWRNISFAFLLLLYFIVIIGIRLDDISKQLDKTNDRLFQLLNGKTENGGRGYYGEEKSSLTDTESSLRSINRTLDKILSKLDKLSM
jgi:hypothetical protein